MIKNFSNRYRNLSHLVIFLFLVGLPACATVHGQVPAFTGDSAAPASPAPQTAVLAGGCFWGVDAVFKHVKGVTSVVSGYSGGSRSTADYETVSTGTTGHAESVQITFDPAQISYAGLLRIYFSVATDPTQLNRQGPDTGTQYRGVIFYANQEQKNIAQAYVDQLDRAKVFRGTIVTQIVPLQAFYPAEGYHQNYLALHPMQPYIVYNDLPKLHALKKEFPDLYKE